MIPILYDGWPLSYSPNSPGALHLLTLLETHPPEFEPWVALPASPPEWFPPNIPTRLSPMLKTPLGRLTWEQRSLPELARQVDAKLVHLTTSSPALFSPVPNVISPAGFGSDPGAGESTSLAAARRDTLPTGQPQGLVERLRHSLSRGAQARVLGMFWPDDLPYHESRQERVNLKKLPPVVHPAFFKGQKHAQGEPFKDLPEAYLLYHGPYNHFSTQSLLNAWSWADGPIGESCPLVLVGVDSTPQPLHDLISKSGLEQSIRILPALPPEELAQLYRGCTSLFHPMSLSVWGGPVRHALASGRPVIAAKSTLAEALVGRAAYLVPESDFRGMGAAMITVVVEEELEESLSLAAQALSDTWDPARFGEKLGEAYRELTGVDE